MTAADGRSLSVGFIGLGAMGQAVAANLLRAGHRVRVWNRSPGPAQRLATLGATVVATAAEAFQGDACLSMLADDQTTRAVFLDGGALPAGTTSTIHVNLATISVRFADEFAALHAERGIPYVAAPVFGAVKRAEAAQLHVLAAGDPAAIERVAPLFDAIGQRTWALGPVPSRANVVKIAGNFMVAAAIEAIGESAALAEAHHLDPANVLEILTTALFDVPVYRYYGELIRTRRYDPAGFKLRLGLKDVRLALEAGEETDVPLPIASLLRDAFLDALAHGDGEKDWAAIAEVAARRAGLRNPKPSSD